MSARSLVAALAAAALFVSACTGEPAAENREESPAPEYSPDLPEGAPTFGTGRALIRTDDGTALLEVEIADDEEKRAFGLMHREHLPEDRGMVFLFFEEAGGGFWMKNTLIPLSIAFFGEDGEILAIMDMEPCEEDPCPVYDPGVAYWGALEVNQSAFDRLGVEEGDRITVVPSVG
jgi:uncharacterized protein